MHIYMYPFDGNCSGTVGRCAGSLRLGHPLWTRNLFCKNEARRCRSAVWRNAACTLSTAIAPEPMAGARVRFAWDIPYGQATYTVKMKTGGDDLFFALGGTWLHIYVYTCTLSTAISPEPLACARANLDWNIPCGQGTFSVKMKPGGAPGRG